MLKSSGKLILGLLVSAGVLVLTINLFVDNESTASSTSLLPASSKPHDPALDTCFTTFKVAGLGYKFDGEIVRTEDNRITCNAHCADGKVPEQVSGAEFRCVFSDL